MPAVASDAQTGAVLMLAYMNADALAETIATGYATYWSRSRASLWRKGETSGNRQRVTALHIDCDQDAIWLVVEVEGHGATCHNGYRSCFYRHVPTDHLGAGDVRLDAPLEVTSEPPLFDPADVYGSD